MSRMNKSRCNINCYQVLPKSSRYVLENSSGSIREPKENYRIFNIGRVPVRAEAKYGTVVQWIGTICGRTVEPGTAEILPVGNRPYYVTGIYLENNESKGRVLAHCGFEDNNYFWYVIEEDDWVSKLDINAISKKLVLFGVSKIPEVRSTISAVIGFFWPENGVSVWDQIKNQVTDLIDFRTMETIRGILGGDIRYFEGRIKTLIQEMETHGDVSGHYMNIAEDLIGFERKFAFSKEDNSNADEINYHILPLFSSLVSLKMTYYQFGILNWKTIRLSTDQVQRLKENSKRLIEGPDGAINHITGVLNERINHELNTCNPDNVFNALVTVRTYCGLSGTEYFDYWRHILEHPESTTKPYNNAITYSTVFGRPTPIQARQIVPEEVEQPLQPKLINGKRNKIAGIDIWLWRMNNGRGNPKIGGLKIYFDNGDSYEMGGRSDEERHMDFKGAYCTKLMAMGSGALDYFEFTFSDGRVKSYGTKEDYGSFFTEFQLHNHHIAGIYLGNDISGLRGQAANITVSYQLTPKE